MTTLSDLKLRTSALSLLALAGFTAGCATSMAARPAARTSSNVEPAAVRLTEDVRWLADPAREGRRAGTEPAKAAGEWIAARMTEIGLTPLGVDGMLQEFSVALDARDGGTSKLESGPVSAQGGERIAPLFCSSGAVVRGPLAWCGYGIESQEHGWNDFEHLPEGAIAVIVRGTPPAPPAEAPAAEAPAPASPHDTQISSKTDAWGNSGSIFTKVMTAKRKGAVGVVLLPGKPDEAHLRFEAGHGARAEIPAVAVDAKTAEALVPGYGNGLGDAPAERRDLGGEEATLVADVLRDAGPAYNVLGLLPGRDHGRAVVVGAHYDHLGRGGTGSLAPAATGEIHHGADDNASGTAVVLEMARVMKAGEPPPCDVLFALWSGEEEGLLGSEFWAQHPTLPLDKIVANLNLDMVGRAGDGKLQVLGAGTSPDFAGWMAEVGERSGLELVVSTTGGALGGSSDHQTFLKREIPALHLFSGLHTDYHKPSDTADKFEADGAAKVAVLGVDLIERMAGAGELAFVEPKIDKERAGEIQGGFRAWFGSMPSYSYEGKGVLIDGTSGASPAERAGFLKGDVLLQMGDIRIDNIYDFTYALQHYKPGDVVLVRYEREGKTEETRVTLSSRGKPLE